MAGLVRLRGRSRFGEAKARPSTSYLRVDGKTWMPATSAGTTNPNFVVAF
jgi:hypothetical protein